MKSIALLFFLIGIIMIVLGICKNEKENCHVTYQTQKIANNYLDDILSNETGILNEDNTTLDSPNNNENNNYTYNIM